MGKIRLLTDPWFEGTAFDGGWALRWDNPEAYKLAATATHMWISHPHSDHLHHITLKRLQAFNPDITILANESYNYSLAKQMRSLGFHSIITFPENTPIPLGEDCLIRRTGSGIIDSLLVIRWNNLTIMNLNDCVLQKKALQHIAKKIGKIDLLLCNFNHAGKLLHHPEKMPGQVRASLTAHYRAQIDTLRPRCAVPFASFHRYISPLSTQQNASLLEPSDLETVADGLTRTIPLYPAQSAKFSFSSTGVRVSVGDGKRLDTSDAPPMDGPAQEFSEAARNFEQRIAKAFGPLRIFIPTLNLKILETGDLFSVRRGRIKKETGTALPDIEAPLAKVVHWFSNPFGTDAFVVGGHLRILRPCARRLKFFIALLLLCEAKIAPRHMLNPKLWGFLLLRRHEALAALLSCRVSSSYQ